MGAEWKRLTMQNGAWVATVTAIVAGALLWYERPAPLYPTTRDEAEVRFALLERMVAQAQQPFATATNVVGLYPSRWFWIGTGEGEQTAPEMTHGLSGDFLDLWSIGGINGLQRDVADYEFIVTDAESIGFDWWTNNLYADADRFGDYQYLHTNTLYMTTNILEQVGRALSSMRYTLKVSNLSIEPATNQTVAWLGEWQTAATLEDAFSAALSSCSAASPDVPLAGLTDYPLSYHVARVAWAETIDDEWQVIVGEYANFLTRVAWVPAATNLLVWHVGAFRGTGATAGSAEIDEFYHPDAITGKWEIAASAMANYGTGTNGFPEVLYNWEGRIPSSEIAAHIPPLESPPSGSRVMGWARDNFAGEWFGGDWQFQCFTNHAYFWP